MLSFQFTGVQGQLTEEALLTSGMVGQTVTLQFDGFWEELSKTVVFVCGGVCRTVQVPQEDIHMTGISVTIPSEALVGGHRLYVGVYGHMDNGAYVTPTVMVKGPRVLHGADPSQSPDGGNLPVWASIQEQIGQLEELNTAAKESLVAAINEILAITPEAGAAGKDGVDGRDGEDGATFTPHMSEYGVLSWTNDKGLTNPRSQNLTGPDGEKGDKGDKGDPGEAGPSGADGKSAYTYAVEGGYGGSEAEFAAKLAAELPTSLPNPQCLTFTGAVSGSYDGSAAVSITIPSGGSSGDSAAWTVQDLFTEEDLSAVDLPIGDSCEEAYLVIQLASAVKLKASWVVAASNKYSSYGFSPVVNSAQSHYRINFRSLLSQSDALMPFLVAYAGGYTSIMAAAGPYYTYSTNCITIAPYTSGEVIPAGSKFTWVYR